MCIIRHSYARVILQEKDLSGTFMQSGVDPAGAKDARAGFPSVPKLSKEEIASNLEAKSSGKKKKKSVFLQQLEAKRSKLSTKHKPVYPGNCKLQSLLYCNDPNTYTFIIEI